MDMFDPFVSPGTGTTRPEPGSWTPLCTEPIPPYLSQCLARSPASRSPKVRSELSKTRMILNRSSFFRRLSVEDEVAIAVLTLTPRPAHVKASMPSKQVLAKREG